MSKTEESSTNESKSIYNIVQIWWHIEDTFSPHPYHHFRQIKDIYLNKDSFDKTIEKTLTIDLPEYIFSIRAYCRNPNQELAFVVINNEDAISMQVHLPDLSQFPIVINKEGSFSYHIKLEIEYALSWRKDSVGIESRGTKLRKEKENFKSAGKRLEYIWMHLCNLIRPKVDCSSEVSGWLFPEFNITFPRGWEIGSSLKSRFQHIFSRNVKRDMSHILLKILVQRQNGVVQKEILKLSPPDLDLVNGKRKYVYILSAEGQKMYQQLQETSDTAAAPIMTLQYAAELSTIGVIFSFWLPVIFLGLSITILVASILKFYNPVIIMSFLVAYLAYLYTHFSYKKDGYDFPSGKIIVCMVPTIIIIILSSVFQFINQGIAQ